MKSKYHRNQRHRLRQNNLNSHNQKQESNLSRFWRECRERDIRKRKRISNQLKRQSEDNFASTINQLKNDAQTLSKKFAKLNSKKNIDNKSSNRRLIDNDYNDDYNDDKENEMEQSENSRIFFENKEYYSSLHHKYLNSKKSINIQSVYDYFDSFKNDENNLKSKLQQKWQDLKKDVDKSFVNYFNKKKTNKPPKESKLNKEILSNTFPLSQSLKSQSVNPSKHSISNEQKDQDSQVLTQSQSQIIDDEEEHSSMYSLSHLQKSNEYWDFSVKQLKQKLLNMNVSINECIEKRDLIQKIKAIECDGIECDGIESSIKSEISTKTKQKVNVNIENKKKNKASILYDSILLYDTKESKQQIMNRVDLWVRRWSYHRSFRQLLNSILGYKSTDPYYITRGKNGDENRVLMMKSYKKAILLIHPDKHVNSSFEIRYKSGEMFKVLNKYKQKYESRK